jgi:hypothetical protein
LRNGIPKIHLPPRESVEVNVLYAERIRVSTEQIVLADFEYVQTFRSVHNSENPGFRIDDTPPTRRFVRKMRLRDPQQ